MSAANVLTSLPAWFRLKSPLPRSNSLAAVSAPPVCSSPPFNGRSTTPAPAAVTSWASVSFPFVVSITLPPPVVMPSVPPILPTFRVSASVYVSELAMSAANVLTSLPTWSRVKSPLPSSNSSAAVSDPPV